MRSLRELQIATRQAVLSGVPPPGLIAAGGHDEGGRCGVYARAYAARLTAALRENFPALARVVGDEAFDSLARGYIDAQPSRRASIRWFGDGLAAFASERPELIGHPALVDLVRFEWALGCAFDAPDLPVLDAGGLRALASARWPSMRLQLQPSARLLRLQWSIEAAWQAARRDPDGPTGVPAPHEHAVLVWRRGQDAQWRTLEQAEADALARLAGGATFGAICESLVREAGAREAPRLAAGFLGRWVEDGLLARFAPARETGRNPPQGVSSSSRLLPCADFREKPHPSHLRQP